MTEHESSVAQPDRQWFVDSRFGMFIHWGLYSMPARHEWVRNHERITNEEYQKYFERFDPDLYAPKQWAKLARQAGMKYFVITAKHHEGFCLWDSKYTDYKAPNTHAGCDLLRTMLDAFRAEGLKVGIYYSLIDWYHPEFTIDRMHPQRGDELYRPPHQKRDMAKYREFMHNQVRELLTDYGKIDLLWFDFSYAGEDGKSRDDWGSEDLLKMVRELQPHVMVDNRLDLPEGGDFETPEQFMPSRRPVTPDGKPAIWEGCHTFSGSWGYHRDEASWKSVKQCINLLVDCVSMSGNLLMNVGPTARGLFDYRAVERLEGYARWMELHSRSIYGCGEAPAEFIQPQDCRLTYNAKTNRVYVHVMNWPSGLLYLPDWADRVEYAQLLHDGSEVKILPRRDDKLYPWDTMSEPNNPVTLQLPVLQPNVEVPVIELFLK